MKQARPFVQYVSLNVLSMAGLSLYILADTFFIANGVGSQGLAALNLALPVYSFLNGLGLMLGVGGATRFSIARGEGHKTQERLILTRTLLPGVTLGLLLSLGALLLAAPLMRLLGASREVLPYAAQYLRTLLLFSPFFISNNILVAFVRNDGGPKAAMAAMLCASAANILMDYLFVYPLGWGMAGAALATGLAPVLSMGVLCFHFASRRNTLRLTKAQAGAPILRRVLLAGLSSFATEASTGLIMMLFNFAILRQLGDLGVGAYGVISNIALVCMALFTGVAQGVQPLISRSFGKGDSHGVHFLQRCALITAGLLGLLFYAVLVPLREEVVRIFNLEGNQLLQQAACAGIPLYFLSFAPMGLSIAAAAGLASSGKGIRAFLLTLCRGLLFPAAFLLGLAPPLGMKGVWMAVPAAEGLGCVLSIVLLHRSGAVRKWPELRT